MKLPSSLKKSSSTVLLSLVAVIAATSFTACYNIGDMVNGAVHDVKHDKGQAIQTQSFANIPKADLQSEADEFVRPTLDQLKNYNWQLMAAEVQGAPIHTYEWTIRHQVGRLVFADNTVYFHVGCNQNLQNYQYDDGVLALTGSRSSTLMACTNVEGKFESLHQVETKLANHLNGAEMLIDISVQDHTAVLRQVKGAEVLTWHGVMKYDVRFGEPVSLFWEIDPATINCIDESGIDQECLKVRNVTYDDSGVKLGAGAWRTFHGEIHGYEHQPNHRQIIRLNAYNNPDSKESPYYVFDMAVETQLVNDVDQ